VDPPSVLDNKLICFHEGQGEDGWLRHCAFDGKDWSLDLLFHPGTAPGKSPFIIKADSHVSGSANVIGITGPRYGSI